MLILERLVQNINANMSDMAFSRRYNVTALNKLDVSIMRGIVLEVTCWQSRRKAKKTRNPRKGVIIKKAKRGGDAFNKETIDKKQNYE